MDKEQVIEILIKYYFNSTIDESFLPLIVEYCVEKGKEQSLSTQFAIMSFQFGIVQLIIPEILDYYKIKFEICTLTDKNNKLIAIF